MPFNVNVTDVTKDGQFAVVKYTYKGTPGEKKVPLFGPNKAAGQIALKLNPGDVVSVTTEKNAKSGYTDWVGLEVSGGGAAGMINQNPPAKTSNSSTYPTKEEREMTQIFITRQSSLANALKFLELQGDPLSLERLLETADVMVDWVMRTELPNE